MLHRRHGVRVSDAEGRRRQDEHYERARAVLRLDSLCGPPHTGASPGSVAIVGGGLAGCAAAYVANRQGFDVKLFEALDRVGGRVWSSDQVVDGRMLEKGAELIGRNHPLWLCLARCAGLELVKVDFDDRHPQPARLKGRSYDWEKLYRAMTVIYKAWAKESEARVEDTWAPWEAPDADRLDSESLAAHIPAGTDGDVTYAIETDFLLNNTVSAQQQSWLANLNQIKAGGGWGFFEDTEVYRCRAGNQALAKWLAKDVHVVPRCFVEEIVIDPASGVRLTGPGVRSERFDYVVFATSVAVWPSIRVQVSGAPDSLLPAGIQHGPAIKYLAPVKDRFWQDEGLSPDGVSDVLGMTWEGTSSSLGAGGVDLSVFAGGVAAQKALDNHGRDAHFRRLIEELYPAFSGQRAGPGAFVPWPEIEASRAPNLRAFGTGYSCPGLGEVVGLQKRYSEPLSRRLYLAGEHTSPRWFGFMEGALESGVLAARRVARAAGVTSSG